MVVCCVTIIVLKLLTNSVLQVKMENLKYWEKDLIIPPLIVHVSSSEASRQSTYRSQTQVKGMH